MSGGDVRVLRQEAGQDGARMPAWKREILERRKAKGGGSPAETSPGAAAPHAGSVNGGAGRNYTITPASQHFSHNKEPRPAAGGQESLVPQESLVLQESLGPLQDNPFIKLEKERRRRQDRDAAARPVHHILELYGTVPGIRTIRADNIIIIESDPDYLPEAGAAGPGSRWQQNGVSGCSSLNDLLERRGSGVTEIRAKEVVIYDTSLSRSEENLSTLGRPDPLLPQHYEAGEGQGRVSRMLQKFDTNYGKLQKKSHSTENLLELDCGAGGRPRPWSKPQPDLVPKPWSGGGLGGSHPPSPVFQSPWSSKPKPPPAACDPASPQPLGSPPQSVASFRQRFEESGGYACRDEPDRGPVKPTRERDWEGAEVPPKPKVPCSPETRRARAESPSGPAPFKVARSSPDFEIRPAPKPDLDRIPKGDTQALALANLRLQSRNSFTVIPKRRPAAPSGTSSPTPPGPIKSSPLHRAAEVTTPGVPTSPTSSTSLTSSTPTPSKRKEEEKVLERVVRAPKPGPSPNVATSPTPPPTSEPLSPSPALAPPPLSPAAPSSPPPSPPTLSPTSPAPEPPVDHLPVTNIDDIEVGPRVPSTVLQKRKNTFTVVPKRRADAEAQPSSPEPPQDASAEAPPGSTPPQAPYAQLGSLLKKRYPAVEEIEVIGGYLSLAKSCLAKTGSTGKKLKISFNESSLQSTYEYPSESSAWDSGEEDDDGEEEERREGKMADEQPSMVGRIHIPRPTFAGSPAHAANSNDLSSYIPKHSVDFSAWQEHKHDDAAHQEDAASHKAQVTEEVMLTPADSSSLSDYSSEPALYF